MTTATITEKQQNILNAISKVEEPTIATVAKFLGLTNPAVMGTMASLKKNGLVETNEGVISITDAGKEALTAQTAEARVAESTVAKIETPSVPKAQQTEGSAKAPRAAVNRADSKAAKAQAIFDQFSSEKRSVLMEKLMTEVGLTKNGANTYIYNMRKKAGLVTPRGTTAAPAEAAATETQEQEAPTAEDQVETPTEATIDPEAAPQDETPAAE